MDISFCRPALRFNLFFPSPLYLFDAYIGPSRIHVYAQSLKAVRRKGIEGLLGWSNFSCLIQSFVSPPLRTVWFCFHLRTRELGNGGEVCAPAMQLLLRNVLAIWWNYLYRYLAKNARTRLKIMRRKKKEFPQVYWVQWEQKKLARSLALVSPFPSRFLRRILTTSWYCRKDYVLITLCRFSSIVFYFVYSCWSDALVYVCSCYTSTIFLSFTGVRLFFYFTI